MLCFRKLAVAKKSTDKRERGEYQGFQSKIFCLRVLKDFVGEAFRAVFQKNSASEKAYGKEGRRGVSRCFVKNFFYLTASKIPIGESIGISIISGIEKVWIRGWGVSRLSVENFLSHRAECFHRGIL